MFYNKPAHRPAGRAPDAPPPQVQFTEQASKVFWALMRGGPDSLYGIVKTTDCSPSTAHGVLKTGVEAGLLTFSPNLTDDGKQVGRYSIVNDQRLRIAEAIQASDAAYAARAATTSVRKPRLNLPRLGANPAPATEQGR